MHTLKHTIVSTATARLQKEAKAVNKLADSFFFFPEESVKLVKEQLFMAAVTSLRTCFVNIKVFFFFLNPFN